MDAFFTFLRRIQSSVSYVTFLCIAKYDKSQALLKKDTFSTCLCHYVPANVWLSVTSPYRGFFLQGKRLTSSKGAHEKNNIVSNIAIAPLQDNNGQDNSGSENFTKEDLHKQCRSEEMFRPQFFKFFTIHYYEKIACVYILPYVCMYLCLRKSPRCKIGQNIYWYSLIM